MKSKLYAVLACLCLGLFSLHAQSTPPPEALPRLAVLPLKEEGTQKLGNVSDTMNTLVANAFLESHSFQLVERHQVQTLLSESKYQHSGLVDESSIAEMGKHLGVRYVLVGSYLSESDRRSGDLVVTLSLRLVDVENATVYKSFMAIAEGSTFGSVLGKLTDTLAQKTANLLPADVSGTKTPRVKKAVLILRVGAVTCAKKAQTHAEPENLVFFNEKPEDYDFLLTELAKLLPAGMKVEYDSNPEYDLAWFVKTHKPDALVVVTFDRTGKIHTFSQESEHRVEVRVEVMDPTALTVIGTRTVATDQIKSKLYEVFPLIKAELTDRIAKEIKTLPF